VCACVCDANVYDCVCVCVCMCAWYMSVSGHVRASGCVWAYRRGSVGQSRRSAVLSTSGRLNPSLRPAAETAAPGVWPADAP